MNQFPNDTCHSILIGGLFCFSWLAIASPNSPIGQDGNRMIESHAAGQLNVSDSQFHKVSGKVVTQADQPVALATIMARRMYEFNDLEGKLFRSYQFARPKHDPPFGRTNREGEFQLSFMASPANEMIFAYRSGFAPSGAPFSPNSSLRIELRPGVSVTGTVLDEDSRPIKSAKVRLMAWFNYEANLASLAEMHDRVELEGDLDGSVIRLETQTAGNGSFQLNDLPKDRWVVLVVSANKFLPRCVVIDTGNDPALESAVSILRFFDEGTIRLQPATQVELVAVAKDDDRPINIQAAYASAKAGMISSGLDTDHVLKLDVQGNRAMLPVLPPGAHRFWLVPDAESGYMSAMLDIEKDGSTTSITRNVELIPGARVVGRVVDSVTGKPIADVPIHYEPESSEEFSEIASVVPTTKSNANGDFTMIVPPIAGWLRQIGLVDGYRSIGFDLNKDVREFAPSQKILPSLTEDTRVEFRLHPGVALKLMVLDAQGQPVARARYITKQWISKTSSKSQSGMADEQGRIELPNMFAAMLTEPFSDDKSVREPLEEMIYICSPDLTATATVRLPYPDQWRSEISMHVVLNPATSIQGRLVDFEQRRGIESVSVNVWYHDHLAHWELGMYSTQTDANGNFTLRPVFPDLPFRLNISAPFVGYRSEQTYEAPFSTDYQLGDIDVFDYRDLEQLLEVPDVTGVSTEQAFEKLSAALSRVRSRMDEVYRWQSGWSRSDSIAAAAIIVSERYGEAFLRLSQQSKDPDLAFAILLHPLANSNPLSTRRSFFADRAITVLLERFMHRENELVDLLPILISSDDIKHWQHVYEKSKNDQLKARACVNLVTGHLDILASMVISGSSSEQQISNRIVEVRPLLRYAFGEAGGQPLNETETLRMMVAKAMTRASEYVEGRASELDSKKKALFKSMVAESWPDHDQSGKQ